MSSSRRPSDLSKVIYFEDTRRPEELQAILERIVSVVFNGKMENGLLTYRANTTIVGATYLLILTCESAKTGSSGDSHSYSFHMDVSWPLQSPDYADFYRTGSSNWFDYWTREFSENPTPKGSGCQGEQYSQVCSRALEHQAQFDSVRAIQDVFIVRVQAGSNLCSSHKEGGTIFSWSHNHFLRTDFGENPAVYKFRDVTDFLNAVYQYFHWELSGRTAANSISETDAWRLILRKLPDS